MLFSRIVSFLTLGAIAFAIPAPKAEPEHEKRQSLDSVLSILTSLESALPLSSLSGLGLGSISGTAAIAPLIAEAVTALDSATTSLSLLSALGGLGLEKRADKEQVAQKVADVTTKLATTFSPIKDNENFVIFGGLLGEVDVALKGVLVEVNVLVDGVLVTVAGLVVGVVGTLEGLLFTLTAGLLVVL